MHRGALKNFRASEDQADLFEDAPLLVAARAVGRTLGVEVCAPAAAEDLQRFSDPLEAIARASRIRIRRVLLRDDWWAKDCGPLLGRTTAGDRPVALLPASAARYELFDPVEMTRTSVDARTASTLSPVAYMMYRPLPEAGVSPLGLLGFALKGRSKDLLSVLLTGIATTLLSMIVPLATAVLIDQVIPRADHQLLWQVALGLLVVVLSKTIFDLAQGFSITRLEIYSTTALQAAIWDRLLSSKLSFLRKYSTGDLQFRAMAVSTIYQQLSATAMRVFFVGFVSLANILLMFYLSVRLAAVAVAAALLVVTATTASGLRISRTSRQLLAVAGNIYGLAVQLIGGVSKLRVSGAEKRAFAFWGKSYGEQQSLSMDVRRISDHINVFNLTLPVLASALLLWLAVVMSRGAGSGEAGGVSLTAGTFIAFYAAFTIFIAGATTLSNTVIDVLSVLNLWERVKPILEAEPEVDAHKAHPGRLSGGVVLDHVTFRYREDGPLTLDGVSIRAEPGEFIALIGPSGSGKSTILRLMLGFETPLSGTISYDGQNLSGLDLYAVRRQLGVVLQNGKIISASIFENIAAGALISLDEAWEAARAAAWADDIADMPMGMHTHVSEGGTNLSGGQRQRLLIARALVSKPRILLFDEATSSLDNRTQAVVTENLDRLQATRVVIAHRLSTIRHATRIYVIDSGRVVQQGTFDELANEQGMFAQLMARQTM